MKVVWLGQAEFLLEIDDIKIVIDPYLSDSIAEKFPSKKRRVDVYNSFLELKPDVIILTHNHKDHTDNETLKHYLKNNSQILVLASSSAWEQVKLFGGLNNFVRFTRHTEWSYKNVTFSAVKAEHSDETAIGVIINACGKRLYFTGDTLYNTEIFDDLPANIDYVFLPINGYGNNMNMIDGKRFCEKIGAKAIPMHCGLFDDIDMNKFEYQDKIIPEIYKEINILYLEDPCWGIEGMSRIRKDIHIPIATNMCVVDFDSLPVGIRENACDIILADAHKWGGIWVTKKLAAVCEAFHLGMSMHAGAELGVSTAVNIQLAASTPQINYSIDGHYHHELDDIIKGGKHKYINGKMRVPDAPGIGVELDDEKVEFYHERWKKLTFEALNGERPETDRHFSRCQF